MSAVDQLIPRARAEGLLVREMPDGELMIYDTERHQGHSLNRMAALVWRHCAGQTNVRELVALLHQHHLAANEDVVWLALDRLERAHLLQERLAYPAEEISRRAAIRKLGRAAGLAALIPVVTSIAAPAPAQAESGQAAAAGLACRAAGGLCFTLPCPDSHPTNIGFKDCRTSQTPEETCCA
jgi:hypothetical protein